MFLAHTSVNQADQLAAAVVGAMRPPSGWCSQFQPHFLSLIFRELLEVEIVFQRIPGLSVAEASVIFPDPLQGRELIELLVLTYMMVNPIPVELERSLEHWADALNVHDRSLVLARDVAIQARAQAQSDFYRLFWMGEGGSSESQF